MKRILTLLSATALLGVAGSALAQFSSGNLAVTVADITPNGSATRLRIIELRRHSVTKRPDPLDGTPTGRFYDLPVTPSGLNRRLTVRGANSREGRITLSDDGKYLLIAGYDAAPGTASAALASAFGVNRIIGRVDYTKPASNAIDATTALDNLFDSGSVYSVTSADGMNFLLAGNGGAAQGGVGAATLGATFAVPSYGGSAVNEVRSIRRFEGGVYVAAANSSGPLYGIGSIASGQTQPLATFPNDPALSSADFYWLDNGTVYVADERTDGNGGIQQWTNASGVWSDDEIVYDHIPAADGVGYVGIRAIAGTVFFDINEYQFEAEMYAITTDNRLVFLQDDDGRGEVITLTTAAPGQEFRGVALIAPKTVSIGGIVTLTGAANSQVLVHVEFRPTIGTPYFTRDATLAADGSYRIDNVPAGSGYQIHVKADNYLAANLNANTFSLSVLNANVTLQPGDANNDNFCDVLDFGMLVNSYGGFYDINNPNANPEDFAADFNHDGSVDVLDFGELVNNYGTAGDP